MKAEDGVRGAIDAPTVALLEQDGVPGAGGESALCAVFRSVLLPVPHANRAAVIVLNDAGCRVLRDRGHAAVASLCAPDAPPSWVRFVDVSLAPELNSCPAARVQDMLHAPWPLVPVLDIAHSTLGAGFARLRMRIPPDLAQFRGHFAAMPIVPGMTLVGWALQYARQFAGAHGSFAGLEGTKFRRIVQPGQLLGLSVTHDRQRSVLEFEYTSEQGQHASGRVRLGPGLA